MTATRYISTREAVVYAKTEATPGTLEVITQNAYKASGLYVATVPSVVESGAGPIKDALTPWGGAQVGQRGAVHAKWDESVYLPQWPTGYATTGLPWFTAMLQSAPLTVSDSGSDLVITPAFGNVFATSPKPASTIVLQRNGDAIQVPGTVRAFKGLSAKAGEAVMATFEAAGLVTSDFIQALADTAYTVDAAEFIVTPYYTARNATLSQTGFTGSIVGNLREFAFTTGHALTPQLDATMANGFNLASAFHGDEGVRLSMTLTSTNEDGLNVMGAYLNETALTVTLVLVTPDGTQDCTIALTGCRIVEPPEQSDEDGIAVWKLSIMSSLGAASYSITYAAV